MNSQQTTLKLNALLYLLLGAMCVFIPQLLIPFLSETSPAPEILILTTGVIFNLLGMILLWLGNQKQTNHIWLKLYAVVDMLSCLSLFMMASINNWITSTNGITTAGLVAILFGWLGWQLWQQSSS